MAVSTGKVVAGGGIIVAAAMAIAMIGYWPSNEQPGDVPQGPETVVLLPNDGGIAYIMPVLTADGGTVYRFTTPKCVRRPVGVPVDDCKRSFMGPFGPMVVDPGALTRFPEGQKVGTLCQTVACSVMFGDNPDLEEIDIAQNYPLDPPDDSM